MLNYLTMGQRIKDLRKRKRLTQSALAELVGCSTAYISYLECGYKCMGVEKLITIANALGTTADILLSECFDNNYSISTREMEEVLADCSQYERNVILDAAKAIKTSMRDNQHNNRRTY